MPKNTAKIHTQVFAILNRGGTLLEPNADVMFGFTPPPGPETTPTPCPHCAGREAIAFYATVRTEYFRCVSCGRIWMVTHEEEPPRQTAAA